MSESKVKAITVDVAGVEVRMSLEDARALYRDLKELFGRDVGTPQPWYTPGIQPCSPKPPFDITPTCSFNELEP